MKHLHFVQSIELRQGGGLGKAALDLHTVLLEQGETSRLLTTARENDGVARAGVSQFPRMGPDALFLAPQLAAAAGEAVAGADVVHGHGFYVFPNAVLGRQARMQETPLVYHPHGMLEPWILNRSRWKKRLAHLLFEDANFRHAALWRALTEREAEQIRKAGVTAPIVIAPNGVRLEEFDAVEPGPGLDGPVLLFMGRLHPKKGLDLLCKAWEATAARHGAWRLVIAGPDEVGMKADLERWRGQLAHPDRVSIPGPQRGADKVRLLKSASAFILPSHSEGFPLALLEAMACRVPVLATHACNLPDAGASGWLCDASAGGVTEALEALLTCGQDELRQRGAAARALIELRYTWNRVVEPLLEACRDLKPRQ